MKKELTKEIIESASDLELRSLISDSIDNLLPTEGDEMQSIQKLTKGQQSFFIVMIVRAEVNNGGFNQFYWNASRKFAPLAVDAFTTIGATRFADLMARANDVFLSIKDELEKYKDGSIDGFKRSFVNNPLNDLDSEFDTLNEGEELDKICIAYVRSHISEFVY